MTPENFVYWLQGYFELNNARIKFGAPENEYLSPQQIIEIKNHLSLVLKKETPNRQVFQQAFGEKAAEDIFCGSVVTRYAASC